MHTDLSSCGTLSEPLGGYISYGTSSGTKATAALTCFYGYLPLNSHNKRECPVESTSWTADPFTCIRKLICLYIVGKCQSVCLSLSTIHSLGSNNCLPNCCTDKNVFCGQVSTHHLVSGYSMYMLLVIYGRM